MAPRKRHRCPFCGRVLPAWLPAAKRPDGALLLGHLSQQHLTKVRPYLERMRTQDITQVAAEAYEVVDEQWCSHTGDPGNGQMVACCRSAV
jgi:hypothetical protein